MNDLINRHDTLSALLKQPLLTRSVVRRVLLQMSAAESVEVVRCKYCEYRELAGVAPFMYHCCVHNDGLAGAVSENDFCSHGERRQE